MKNISNYYSRFRQELINHLAFDYVNEFKRHSLIFFFYPMK